MNFLAYLTKSSHRVWILQHEPSEHLYLRHVDQKVETVTQISSHATETARVLTDEE
jgi:hypothetical protein